MAISVRRSGDICILGFEEGTSAPAEDGTRPLGLSSPRLSDLSRTVGRLLEDGSRQFVLDLGPVAYLDSAGFGELIASLRRTQREGGGLRLLHVTGKVRERLEVLNLDCLFEIFEDESAALGSFRRKAPRARRSSRYSNPSTR
jgi:anti-sigma B factor antagonist